MEALAAVGLATNIITFVDFAATLVKGAKEISVSGSFSDLDRIQAETAHLEHLIQPLKVYPGLSGSGGARGLANLTQECAHVADEIAATLANVYVRGPSPSCIDNIKVALRAMRNKRKLESLQKRLDSCRGLILTQITTLILQDQTSIFKLAKDISKRHDENAVRIGDQLDSLRGDVISAIDRNRTDPTIDQSVITRLLEDVQSKLEKLFSIEKESHRVKTILDKLWFDSMLDREASVHEAQGDSYQWLLSSPRRTIAEPEETKRQQVRDDFSRWLTSGSGLFYISGKAGSGKSTLMKFLVQNTRAHLDTWATFHRRKLLVVSFFFWISGTPNQRSVEGLYRAILWEILRKCPQLIPAAFPSRWKDTENKDARTSYLPLSLSEIEQAFERLQRALESSHVLCLFIDGLDECGGGHWRLGHELASWSSDYVKICVSARPFNAFEQTLPRDASRHFRLQDLNERDIRGYIESKLFQDQRFRELQAQDGLTSLGIIDILVINAEGVFLWIVLAIRTLLDGLGNRYSAMQLLRFLDTDIPSDLEAMFLQMLDRLPELDRKLAAISLLLMTGPPFRMSSVSALGHHAGFHWYIEESLREWGHFIPPPDELSRLKLRESTLDQVMAAKSRFKSRCANFIDWMVDGKTETYRFTIIHRTLHDFILQPKTRLRLHTLAETADVSFVAASACLNILHDFPGPQIFGESLSRGAFLGLVHIAENSREKDLEHFEKIAWSVIEDLPEPRPISTMAFTRGYHPCIVVPGRKETGFMFAGSGIVTISNESTLVFWLLASDKSWGFLNRTRQKVIHHVPDASKPTILLTAAIFALLDTTKDASQAIHFIRFLLEEIDPNSTIPGRRMVSYPLYTDYIVAINCVGPDGVLLTRVDNSETTVWEFLLRVIFTTLRKGASEGYMELQLIELFLTFGAHPDAWYVEAISETKRLPETPTTLPSMSLRQMLALRNLPISDTMAQYLGGPGVDLARSSSNLNTTSEASKDRSTAS